MNASLPRHLVTLGLLAQIELDIRTAEDAAAVQFMAVNDLNRIVPFDHALLWQAKAGIVAISGGLAIDRTQPQMHTFARLGAAQAEAAGPWQPTRIIPAALPATLAAEADRWLGADCLWVPLVAAGRRLEGGLFLFRSEPFNEADLRVLARLGSAVGSALAALSAGRTRSAANSLNRHRVALMAGAAVVAAMAVPVRLSVLADAKVVPLEPHGVSAPIDGVIKTVHVKPNATVARGDVLWSLVETELAAARDIAEKRVLVLTAEQARAEQSGFRDARARSEIAVLQSRLAEGEADLAWASERLARTEVVAPEAGVVMFDDPVSWVGRPVRVGERVMLVADPARVRLEIAVAVEDALIVQPGADVAFFMAVAPDEPLAARVQRISYDARILPSQAAAFMADADFAAPGAAPRLGATGTAKVYGDRTTLFYAIFRKPLAALRRLIGL